MKPLRPVQEFGVAPERRWDFGDASFSPCTRYRYVLERAWGNRSGLHLWIMLNPSTADATQDDPTIRRCMGFTAAAGGSRMIIVNLYARRATDPLELCRGQDPIGPYNDFWLRHDIGRAAAVVCAWGNGPWKLRDQVHLKRIDAVMRMIGQAGKEPLCLGVTKAGMPKHPLYVAGDTPLVPYEWAGS